MKVDRQKWLEARKEGIGSSEIAMVLGCSPYGNQVQLYGEKVGLLEHSAPEVDDAEMGNEMEEVVAKRFASRHPEFVIAPAPFIRSAIHPWIQASPDRLLLDPKTGHLRGVLEAKYAGSHNSKFWGEDGSDHVPPAFHAQVGWSGIALKMNPVRVFDEDDPLPPMNGKPIQRFVAACIGSKFREYPIPIDDELDGIFVEHGRKFWSRVLDRIPPTIDGSPSSHDLIKALYPSDSDPVRVATVKETELLGLLRPRMDAAKRLEGEIDLLKNQLRESIGTASGIVAPGVGQLTNKKTKDGQDTDWKALVAAIQPHVPLVVFDQAKAECTKIKAGYRRFLPKWEGEVE